MINRIPAYKVSFESKFQFARTGIEAYLRNKKLFPFFYPQIHFYAKVYY
jgi:hypothetical protein